MAISHEMRGSAPPEVRQKCPYCGSNTIRIVAVPWYPELEYLTCEKCGRTWTIERKS